MSLEGKVAVVTGAGKGIGAAVARGFARSGAQVVVHYNSSADAAQAVADELAADGTKVTLVQADMTDREAVARMFADIAEQLGSIDILVNNAGGITERSLIDETP